MDHSSSLLSSVASGSNVGSSGGTGGNGSEEPGKADEDPAKGGGWK